jgi:hypothetical protein
MVGGGERGEILQPSEAQPLQQSLPVLHQQSVNSAQQASVGNKLLKGWMEELTGLAIKNPEKRLNSE